MGTHFEIHPSVNVARPAPTPGLSRTYLVFFFGSSNELVQFAPKQPSVRWGATATTSSANGAQAQHRRGSFFVMADGQTAISSFRKMIMSQRKKPSARKFGFSDVFFFRAQNKAKPR